MARQQKIVMTDDLDGPGTPAAETVEFALDGVAYEIDLSEANAARLRDQLALWVGHARRRGRAGAATPPR